MALMDPVETLVDDFYIGPLTVDRQAQKTQNATFGFTAGAITSFTLDPVAAIAATGVERISVGAITHSAIALPMKLERVQ